MAYCSRLRNAVGEEFTPVTMTTVSRTNKPRIFIESAEDGEVIEGILMANPKHLLSDDASLLPNRVNEPVNVHLQLDEPVYVPERVCFFVDDPDDRAIHLDQRPSWSEDRCSATLAFIPTRPGRHLVRVEGERLHVAPLQYDVIDDAEFVRVVLPNTWTEGAEPMTEQRVGLELGDVDEKRIRAQWTDPSGRRHTLRVDKDPATQKHRLLITPDSSGTWELFVTCDGRPVPGSPFPLDVLSPVGLPSKSPVNSRRSSTLTSSSHTSGVYNLLDSTDGPGGELTMWSSEPLRENRDCCVNVRLGDREGELSALVTKHGMVVPSDVLPREERSVQQVRFRPDEPGEYKVTVFLGGQIGSSIFHLKRSLNSAAIRCSGPGLKIVPIETETWFRIHADGDAETARLSVKLTAPSGNFIATEVRESHEKIVVDYTPREVGRHQLEVCLDKENVFGSPFEVDVFDANAVKVYYEPLVEINEETYFEVDLSRAGRAPLDCCVFSPTGEAVSLTSPHDNHTISSDPRLRFSYCPREAGPHRLGVHFGETEVPLSPFLQQAVREIGSQGREEEPAVMQPVAYGEGLIRAETDWPAVFFVDPKNKKGDLFVKVDGPNSVAKCNIEPEGVTGKYRVTYVPTVVGRYAVNVEWNKQSVPNSPFRPIVVAPGMVHCPDLRFSSSRPLDPLIVGRKKELVCSTEDAGPGTMRAEVRGPGGAPLSVRVKERDSGAVVVRFTPAHPGPHRLSLFWGELPLPGIPFEGEAVNEQPLDHSKVILSGRGLKEARVNEEAEFIIDGKQAGPGRPTILMKGVHTEVDVEMESVLEHRYKCSYVPTVVGAYLLTIWWSERQLRGSPFKVTVVAPSDASKVVCSGDGLSHGVLGEEMDCQIDTRRAGPGELTALCSGGQKVAYCELYDHRDGTYSLKIKPQETGRHVLQIKFGGEHVHGSPFIARVSNAPDASCVRVFGPGVEHGILDNFQSRFIVETRGAGAGQLTVRVRGPRGAFRVEMERETRKDRTILCRYDPTEPGEYWINITWSGHHVPGSPFRVMLFEKREELRMFARANGLSLDEERSQWQEHL